MTESRRLEDLPSRDALEIAREARDLRHMQNRAFAANLRLKPTERSDFLANFDTFMRLLDERFYPYFEIAETTGLKVAQVMQDGEPRERSVLKDIATDQAFSKDMAHLTEELFGPFLVYFETHKDKFEPILGKEFCTELLNLLRRSMILLMNTSEVKAFFKGFLKNLKLLRERFRRQAWFIEAGMSVNDTEMLFRTNEDPIRDIIDKAALLVKHFIISKSDFAREVLTFKQRRKIAEAVAKLGDLMLESEDYDREHFDAISDIETAMGKALMNMKFMDEGKVSLFEDMVMTVFNQLAEAMRRYREAEMADPKRKILSNQFSRFVILFKAAEADIVAVVTNAGNGQEQIKLSAVDKDRLRDALSCIRGILPELAQVEDVSKHFKIDLLRHLRDDYIAAEKSLRSLLTGINGKDLTEKLYALRGRIAEFDMAFNELVMNGYFPTPERKFDDAEELPAFAGTGFF